MDDNPLTFVFADRDLNIVGDPLDVATSVDITLKFNEPAAGSVTMPALGRLIDLATQPGYSLLVFQSGEYLTGGPIERPGEFSWSIDGGGDPEPGTLTVGFSDDLAETVGRLVYPDPTLEAFDVGQPARYEVTGNAELIMRDLVDFNAGASAISRRQQIGMSLGAVYGAGSTVVLSARFDPLGDVLRSLAIAGGTSGSQLGFRTRRDNTNLKSILFEVYQPNDVSGMVRFSRELGNLRSIKYAPEAPSSTVAIVGGDGTGASRTIVERENSVAIGDGWPRLEKFVNNGSADPTELNQAGDQAMTQSSERSQFTAVAVDTPDQAYGLAYRLGDKVGVQPFPGTLLTDVVSSVRITWSAKAGLIVTPTIGTGAVSTDTRIVQMLREVISALGILERT
jgi:hypothetical protein